MTAEKLQATRKLGTYRILAMRSQIYEIEVKAMSPEGACKTLWERLRRDTKLDAPTDAKLHGSSWNDPADSGHAWMIEGGNLDADIGDGNCQVWNGHEIIRTKVYSLIHRICHLI